MRSSFRRITSDVIAPGTIRSNSGDEPPSTFIMFDWGRGLISGIAPPRLATHRRRDRQLLGLSRSLMTRTHLRSMSDPRLPTGGDLDPIRSFDIIRRLVAHRLNNEPALKDAIRGSPKGIIVEGGAGAAASLSGRSAARKDRGDSLGREYRSEVQNVCSTALRYGRPTAATCARA
jgi:hypothetical protein